MLDCCHAGRAGNAVAAVTAEAARSAGSYLLAAVGGSERAWAPPGEPRTWFTGGLVALLRDGDPTGPPWITLHHAWRHLDRAAQLCSPPLPRPRRFAAGNADGLVLAPNPGYERGQAEAEPPADVPCPYRGLEPFTPDDAADFLGRADTTGELTDRVAAGSGPVVVIGASGSGKTSLLNAGLDPALRERGVGVVRMTPGARPTETWADLERPDDAVLVVDQFEELFTACDDDAERRPFVDLVSESTAPVVLAVRADFYPHCLAYPALRQALTTGQFPLGPLGLDELRQVIEEPAARVGLGLEAGRSRPPPRRSTPPSATTRTPRGRCSCAWCASASTPTTHGARSPGTRSPPDANPPKSRPCAGCGTRSRDRTRAS
ncbi:hypothetical protein V5P93_004318 [Actinokineospora auranticolor]|nr:ATP-binding protein [Actinokineospora auranticolor]